MSTREAKSYAEEESLLFFETSAKTGTNVTEVFTAIANAIPETLLKGATGGAGSGQTALGAGQGQGGGAEARLNLADRAAKSKDNCAC